MFPRDSPDDPADATGPEAVGELLAEAYGITARLERIPVGQATINYRAEAERGALFVKAYPVGTDLAAQDAGIRMSAIAADAGVPVALPLQLPGGQFVAAHRSSAASVWQYVEGRVVETRYSPPQLQAVGRALGMIHRAFAELPASRGPAPQARAWLAFDAGRFGATIDRLLGAIAAKDRFDDFDRLAAETLLERRAQAGRIPGLIAALPALSTQLVHGDFSTVNILMDADRVAAVVDFSPPDPFFTAYEVGRIAFNPRAVLASPDFTRDAAALIDAYRQANPDAPPDAIACSARVALIQLLTSLYGVKQHYLRPGILQADLDRFWLQRHQAATRLLEALPDIEDSLLEGLAWRRS